jgi:N-acetylglucosamine kinase-like BadF-type ATPase
MVGDEDSVLGSGTAAGSSVIRVGETGARESLAAAIRQACAVANVSPQQVQRTCLGMTGAARPEVSNVVHRILRDIVRGEIEVVGDMVIALEAAFGLGPGVIVIAGAGSIAYGRDSQGRTARAGGWGFAISDEGSGYWIGRSAVNKVMRAHDQADNGSLLLEGIKKAWQTETHDQIVLLGNRTPPPDFAVLFPAVLSAAEAGDVRAREVLTRAGAELSELAKIVIRRLLLETGPVPVAMSGGVFRSSTLVRQVFYNGLRAEYSQTTITPTVVDPVRGALTLARRGSEL